MLKGGLLELVVVLGTGNTASRVVFLLEVDSRERTGAAADTLRREKLHLDRCGKKGVVHRSRIHLPERNGTS